MGSQLVLGAEMDLENRGPVLGFHAIPTEPLCHVTFLGGAAEARPISNLVDWVLLGCVMSDSSVDNCFLLLLFCLLLLLFGPLLFGFGLLISTVFAMLLQ